MPYRAVALATTTGQSVTTAGRGLAIQAIFVGTTLNLQNTPDLSALYTRLYALRESGYRALRWRHERVLLPVEPDSTGVRRILWARRTLLDLHRRDRLDLLRTPHKV